LKKSLKLVKGVLKETEAKNRNFSNQKKHDFVSLKSPETLYSKEFYKK